MRRERGAAAVLAGLLAPVIFGTAAMTVDLAQAYIAQQASQRTVDSAALAASLGTGLPAPTPTATCPYGPRANANDPAVKEAAAYLAAHDAFSVGDPSLSTVTPASLVDCDLTNGEVVYGSFSGGVLHYDPTEVSIVSPPRSVGFSLGRVIGASGAKLASTATVKLDSPVFRSLPLYAFTGCDYGAQTIAQPTNGHAAQIVQLASPSDTNSATLSSLVTNPATNPAQVPEGVSSSLSINGSGLASVNAVGFFESGISGPGPAPVVVPISSASTHTDTLISLSSLPSGVTSVPDVWYVRVEIGTTWSTAIVGGGNSGTLAALPLQVGSPTLTCGQGSSAGNFGTLLLPNTSAGAPSGQSDNIAYNIATNIQHGLAVYPGDHTGGLCSSANTVAVLWPQDGTNCVDTKTGLDLNAAQKGFLDGVGSAPGRLTNVSAGTGCAANGMPATTVLYGRTVNNDTLTCFMTQDGTSIGDIAQSTYPFDHPVLSAAIYNSPRFALVPVLAVQPTNGGSNHYQIIDIRPAYITDQPLSATRGAQPSSTNGLTFASAPAGKLASIQVVFLNSGALPPPPTTMAVAPYVGTGLKVLRLIN